MNKEFIKIPINEKESFVFIKKSMISSISVNNDYNQSFIYVTGEKDPYRTHLTPEQIFKLLHNDEFKGKMDEILKDS